MLFLVLFQADPEDTARTLSSTGTFTFIVLVPYSPYFFMGDIGQGQGHHVILNPNSIVVKYSLIVLEGVFLQHASV